MADTAARWEATHLVEALYALRKGLTNWQHLTALQATRVTEKFVSKPASPRYYELEIPRFRFIDYPGGKSLLTPAAAAAAEKEIGAAGLTAAWRAHLSSRSAVVYETKRSGYLQRRVSEAICQAAHILREAIGVERAEPLPLRLTHPCPGTIRIFSSELSESHLAALETAASEGNTVPFKGQPHLVTPCRGSWNTVMERYDVDFELSKTKKNPR